MSRHFKILSFISALLAGCGSHVPIDYKDDTPVFDFKKYFNGDVKAWGMFQDRSGKVINRFEVKMKCEWQGEQGTLHEEILNQDGKKQTRVWNLKITDPHHLVGHANDSIGQAQGELYGNAMRLQYRLNIPVGDKSYEFDFDDWMFMLPDDKVINRAKMKKFGFTVGDITIFFSKNF